MFYTPTIHGFLTNQSARRVLSIYTYKISWYRLIVKIRLIYIENKIRYVFQVETINIQRGNECTQI